MDVSIIAAWNILKQRNNLTFENKQPSLSSWKYRFVEDATLQAQSSSSAYICIKRERMVQLQNKRSSPWASREERICSKKRDLHTHLNKGPDQRDWQTLNLGHTQLEA